MGEFSKAFASEGKVTWEGKTYALAPLQIEVICLWEDWLAERALARVMRKRKWLNAVEFLEERRILQQDEAAGCYDFFGRASVEAQQNWDGQIELTAIRMMVAAGERGMGLDEARKLCRQLQEHNAELWMELQAKQAQMDVDPNSRRRAKEAQEPAATESKPSAPSSPESPGT